MILLKIYIKIIDKICNYVGHKFIFLCNLIGCEAQEGVELTIKLNGGYRCYARWLFMA